MDDLFTVEEVCRRLEVSVDTWYMWRAKRITPRLIRLPNGSSGCVPRISPRG